MSALYLFDNAIFDQAVFDVAAQSQVAEGLDGTSGAYQVEQKRKKRIAAFRLAAHVSVSPSALASRPPAARRGRVALGMSLSARAGGVAKRRAFVRRGNAHLAASITGDALAFAKTYDRDLHDVAELMETA